MAHEPGSKELDFATELILIKSLDDIIESVPNSVITLCTHLTVVATYERLGRDIPLDLQYTASRNIWRTISPTIQQSYERNAILTPRIERNTDGTPTSTRTG